VDYRERITIEPGKRGGKPCIRGLRITVYDILDYLAGGMSEDDILADFPDLQREDIRAALAFAADRERRLVGRRPDDGGNPPVRPWPHTGPRALDNPPPRDLGGERGLAGPDSTQRREDAKTRRRVEFQREDARTRRRKGTRIATRHFPEQRTFRPS
jgi:uncharacterized protein (DUF433 family)